MEYDANQFGCGENPNGPDLTSLVATLVTDGDGQITVSTTDQVSADIQAGSTITLTPQDAADMNFTAMDNAGESPFQWVCESPNANIEARFLPATCR